MSDLDPRWEWAEIRHFCDRESTYIKARCNHLTPIPVDSIVDGEIVAHLCPDCDAQLPAEWKIEGDA